MSEINVVYRDSSPQPIRRQVKDSEGRPIDITSNTVTFSMRYADTSELKVDEGSADGENISWAKYIWDSSDLDEVGEYYGWFTITDGADFYDTSEELVIVSEHAPGRRTRVGEIYEAARSYIPTSWTALEASPTYGDKKLQRKIDVVKLNILGISNVDVEDEITLDIRVSEYIAKLAVLAVIPAAKDYWLNQKITVSNTGTNENTSYPDRIKALEDIQKDLLAQVAAEGPIIGEVIDLPPLVNNQGVPGLSDGTDVGFVTPNPSPNFRDYGFQHNDCDPRTPRRAVDYRW